MSRQALPPTRLTAHSTSLICQDVDIRGDVTIGAGTIVHPKATIIAAAGPIVIGENCVIEETAAIINRRKDILKIGDDNIFMIGCRVEAGSIGDGNTFQPRSKVASGIVVTDHCVFGSATATLPSVSTGSSEMETLEPHTTVYGDLSERRKWDGSGQHTEENLYRSHAEYLKEILPKFNRMRVV